MKKVVAINNKNDLSLSTKLMVESTESIAKFGTEEECIYSYENAETIVDSFYERERNGAVSYIRAKALMELKKLIMGDLWSEHLASVPVELTDRWYKRLSQLELVQKNGRQESVVVDYLKFAKYTFETSKLAGVKIIAPNSEQLEVLTQSMFQKRGKGNKASMIEVSKTYAVLATQYNKGKPFNSAKEVKEAFDKFEGQVLPKKVKEAKKEEVEKVEVEAKVYVRSIFESEVGKEPDITLAPMEFPSKVIEALPQTTRSEFKRFYRLVASVIHPDKGGDETMASILISLNNAMNVVFDHVDEIEEYRKYESEYKQWKEDNGYESEYVPESEVTG